MPLALGAMTRLHKCRLTGRLRAQQAAAAMRTPGHRHTPVLGRSPVGRTWDIVSLSSSAERGAVNSRWMSALGSGRSVGLQKRDQLIAPDIKKEVSEAPALFDLNRVCDDRFKS
jgi:hypothetical protein